jgi:acetyl-CoA/propionyl-CoA carboxylase biotin carboxyl carrier protein
MASPLFDTVLVANRGEIAVRVFRTLRAMGIRSVAVYSDADVDARHVREADEAVRLGPAPARESYLSVPALIEAARRTGAQAIHPGYGFLSENAGFARACAEAGLVFIGPPPRAVEVMGDKIRAKLTVSAAGVPVVPGRTEPDMTDDDLVAAAAEIGFPVLIKPSAGGGGKGMRLVYEPGALAGEIAAARREARSSFGDDTLFLERFVQRPRHIEVQVLADTHGNVIHLGERECSLQRRHQKVIEEAPSALLDEATRARIGAAAADTARSVDYAGAGTVEFIVSADDPETFFFMEMNTRLQVEHPVTELVTGIDLVAEQVRIAAGRPLSVSQDEVRLTGHAVEARVYAEDPARGFLPTGGTVLALAEPAGEGLRVDSGLAPGQHIGSDYDPMLSKIVAWGPDRAEALARLDTALGRTVILGLRTNIALLRALLAHPDVAAGLLDTDLVERELPVLHGPTGSPGSPDVPADALAAYGLAALHEAYERSAAPGAPSTDLWSVPSGFRAGRPAAPLDHRVTLPDGTVTRIRVSGPPTAATVTVGDGEPRPARVHAAGTPGELLVTLDGHAQRWSHVVDGRTRWLGTGGAAWALPPAELILRPRAQSAAALDVRAPMPGLVTAVHVSAGDRVTAGTALIVVDAMKMEHALTAPRDGLVKDLGVRVGDQVRLDQVLAVVTADEDAATGAPDEPATGAPIEKETSHA